MAVPLSNGKKRLQSALNRRKLRLDTHNQIRRMLDLLALADGPDTSIEFEDQLPFFHSSLNPLYEADLSLIEAFQFCGLDHRKFGHWRLLLDSFADATFRSSGAKQKMTVGAMLEIVDDVKSITFGAAGDHTDTAIAKMLKKANGAKYSQFSPARLRKLVGLARNSVDLRSWSNKALESKFQEVVGRMRNHSGPLPKFFVEQVAESVLKQTLLDLDLLAAAKPNAFRQEELDPSEAKARYGAILASNTRVVPKNRK